MTRIGIISQARMTSERLPGKVLLEADGQSMLSHHVRRLRTTGVPVLIATTTNSADEPIVSESRRLDVPVFRGSETDVLGRFAGTTREFGLDVVVRVTSDCPLIDGDLVARGIQMFLDSSFDSTYVSNVIERTYPRGFDFEVFSADALLEADALATSNVDREHVTPYLRTHASENQLIHVQRNSDASRHRVTLDTDDDLALIRALIEQHNAAQRNVEQLIELLERRPELTAINSHVEQKKLGE